MFVVLALTQSSFVEIEKGSTAELLFASDVDEKEGGVAIQKGLYSPTKFGRCTPVSWALAATQGAFCTLR